MGSRPETGVSKAHGGISVLLNFTDFPSPLYRFIAHEGRIISIAVKRRGHCRRVFMVYLSTCSLARPLDGDPIGRYARRPITYYLSRTRALRE
jgi:hypothetical protein